MAHSCKKHGQSLPPLAYKYIPPLASQVQMHSSIHPWHILFFVGQLLSLRLSSRHGEGVGRENRNEGVSATNLPGSNRSGQAEQKLPLKHLMLNKYYK